jgi:hypothetical protein
MTTPIPSPDPTAHFLRLCLAAAWQPAAMAQAQAMAQAPGFDWPAVAGRAQEEQVEPLLYAALRGQPWAPAPLLDDLRTATMRNGGRNALLLAELEAVLSVLAGAGIPALTLKGAALLARIYDNVALRPMVDLDLLLHHADVPAALDLLTAAGYRRPQAEPAAGLTLAFENELLLRKRERIEIALELHWSLFDSPWYQQRLPMAWFWQGATPARVGATPALILGPEAELLHLCGHLALHHQGVGLLWQHDIAAAIVHGRETLDWEGLLARAGEFDLVLPLQTLLPDIAQAWGAPLPAATLARLAAMQPSPDEAQVFAQLSVGQRPVAQRFRADLAAIPAWRDRLRYAWAHLVPAPAYMIERYAIAHRALLPLYYPYRWLAGLAAALRTLSRG